MLIEQESDSLYEHMEKYYIIQMEEKINGFVV